MKPTVLYNKSPENDFIVVGQRAGVRLAENHHNGMIYGGELVSTSTVLNYDPATGVFETRNTIYKPQ